MAIGVTMTYVGNGLKFTCAKFGAEMFAQVCHAATYVMY